MKRKTMKFSLEINQMWKGDQYGSEYEIRKSSNNNSWKTLLDDKIKLSLSSSKKAQKIEFNFAQEF